MAYRGPLKNTRATNAEHDLRVLRALASGDMDGDELRRSVACWMTPAAVVDSIARLRATARVRTVGRRGPTVVYTITDAGHALLQGKAA